MIIRPGMASCLHALCWCFLHVSLAMRAPNSPAAGKSAIMIVSGITSHTELCMAVESGLASSNGAAIVLEPCESAVAAGDGRELWSIAPSGQLVNLASEKCAVPASVDANASIAPRVVLEMCADLANESGRWEILQNGQLRFGIGNGEPKCLSQRGDAPEQTNVALGAAIAASSTLDASAHGAALTLDGLHSTYWVSELGISDPVTVHIDFGAFENLLSFKIVWEFPAQDFSVALSNKDGHWLDVFATDANSAKTNWVRLGSKSAKAIRLTMRAPHIIKGYVNGQGVYGIRSIEAFAWGMHSVLDTCGDAARSDDARDKYFAVHASGHDFSSADTLHAEMQSLTVASSSLAAAVNQINVFRSRMEDCGNDSAELDPNTSSHLLRQPSKQVALPFGRAKHISAMGTDGMSDISYLMEKQHGIDRTAMNDLLHEARLAIVSIRAALL